MSAAPIKVTILGSGTSMGVPSLACHCRVCTSQDPHDNRLRPSLLLSRNGENVIIDTTPDFRQQALRVGLDRLDAILLTHHHADHILGFDDIRPFNIRQKASLPVYSTEETFRVIRRAFAYVFDGTPTQSSIPSVDLHVINGPFELMGLQFVPVPLLHGDLEVLGFRFGRAAYLTDFSSLPETSAALLTDLDDLVIDALRDAPHPMHQTVDQALALIEKLQPRRAWFTHIAHDLSHAETNDRLRRLGLRHVQLAYDGLQFDVRVDTVSTPPRRSVAFPPNDRDLIHLAQHNWILVFDQVRRIPIKISEALCAVSSGEAIETAQPDYRDNALAEIARPIILTAPLDEAQSPWIPTRSLSNRTLTIDLAPIAAPRSEAAVWADFENLRAPVLAALADAVSSALRNIRDVDLGHVARFPDCAVWAAAAAPALGLDPTSIVEAVSDPESMWLGADPLRDTLHALLRPHSTWSGDSATLLTGLRTLAPFANLPSTPKALGQALARIPGINVSRSGRSFTISRTVIQSASSPKP